MKIKVILLNLFVHHLSKISTEEMMLGNSELGLKWGLGSWLSWVQPALQIEISTSNSHVESNKTKIHTIFFCCNQGTVRKRFDLYLSQFVFRLISLCLLNVFLNISCTHISVDWIKSHSSICICLVLPQNPTLIHQISQPSQLNKRCREL